MDLQDRFEVHKQLVVKCLDPDFGLLDVLVANRLLTRQEVAKVKAILDSHGRCEKLLDYVSRRGIFDKFLDALRETKQIHLVNFILSNGQRSSDFGGDWPLTERELSILDTNQPFLVDRMETSDLILRLYSQHVVNTRQRDFLSSKTTSHERNEALLDILRRTSLGNFEKTIHCLDSSKQSHIAKILKEGGADTKEFVDLNHMFNEKCCTNHKNRSFDNYCTDCKRIVCVSCHAESHELHDCKDFALVEEGFRQAIKQAAWKISNFAGKMLSLKENAEIMKGCFIAKVETIEATVLERNQELKDMIDRQKNSLLQKLAVIKSDYLKDMEYQLEEIEKCCTRFRRFESYCTELTSKGSAIDICSLVDQQLARAVELEKDHNAFVVRPHKSTEVIFKTTEAVDNLMNVNCNFVGNVNAVKTERTTYVENIAAVVGLNEVSSETRQTFTMEGADIEDALNASGLRNVTLRNTSGNGISYTIQWMQTSRRLLGCKEQYRKCKYVSPTGLEVAVFVAEISGTPPETLNTCGYNSVLHFGSVGGTIFFVIHPREWTPYKHRFMTDKDAQMQQMQWANTNSYLGSSPFTKVLSEGLIGEYLHYLG